jgi:hypothetical protein
MPFDRPALRTARHSLLPARETLVLENARGTVIAVDHGCLWVTLEGDTRDIVLTDGMRFEIDRDGRTLAVAEEISRVRVSAPRNSSTRFAAFLRRTLRRLMEPREPMLRRPAPYY